MSVTVRRGCATVTVAPDPGDQMKAPSGRPVNSAEFSLAWTSRPDPSLYQHVGHTFAKLHSRDTSSPGRISERIGNRFSRGSVCSLDNLSSTPWAVCHGIEPGRIEEEFNCRVDHDGPFSVDRLDDFEQPEARLNCSTDEMGSLRGAGAE